MIIYYCWGCNSWITGDDVEIRGNKQVHMNCDSHELDPIEIGSDIAFKKWANQHNVKPKECSWN